MITFLLRIFGFFKKIFVWLFQFVLKIAYDMTYENGKPSKGYIGFWVSFSVIVYKFIGDGSDIPSNWLTLILAFLAYNGIKEPVKVFATNKNATTVSNQTVVNNTKTTNVQVKDDEEPVN